MSAGHCRQLVSMLGYFYKSCTDHMTFFREEGFELVRKVGDNPKYLEDVTGLTELMQVMSLFSSLSSLVLVSVFYSPFPCPLVLISVLIPVLTSSYILLSPYLSYLPHPCQLVPMPIF